MNYISKEITIKFILIAFMFQSCLPRNLYYGNHVSESPHMIYLDVSLSKQAYKIVDTNYKNYLLANVPEYLGGSQVVGYCVVEILINDEKKIKNLKIVGMFLTDKDETKKIEGFDMFFAGGKRVTKPGKDVTKYFPFLKEYISKQKIEQIREVQKINKIVSLVYLNERRRSLE